MTTLNVKAQAIVDQILATLDPANQNLFNKMMGESNTLIDELNDFGNANKSALNLTTDSDNFICFFSPPDSQSPGPTITLEIPTNNQDATTPVDDPFSPADGGPVSETYHNLVGLMIGTLSHELGHFEDYLKNSNPPSDVLVNVPGAGVQHAVYDIISESRAVYNNLQVAQQIAMKSQGADQIRWFDSTRKPVYVSNVLVDNPDYDDEVDYSNSSEQVAEAHFFSTMAVSTPSGFAPGTTYLTNDWLQGYPTLAAQETTINRLTSIPASLRIAAGDPTYVEIAGSYTDITPYITSVSYETDASGTPTNLIINLGGGIVVGTVPIPLITGSGPADSLHAPAIPDLTYNNSDNTSIITAYDPSTGNIPLASNADLLDGARVTQISDSYSAWNGGGTLTETVDETASSSAITTYTPTHIATTTDYTLPDAEGTGTLASTEYEVQTGDTYNSIAAGLRIPGVSGAILALMNHADGGNVSPAGSQIYVPTGTGTTQSFAASPISVSGPAIVNLDSDTVTPLFVGGTDSTNAIYVTDSAGDLIDLIDDTGNANPVQFSAGIEQSEPVTGSNSNDTFPSRAYVAISGDDISRLYTANASGVFNPPQALQTSLGVFSLENAPALPYFALDGGTTTTGLDPITGNPSGPYADVSPTASLASFNSASDTPDGAWNIGVDSQGDAVITGGTGSGYSGTATLTQGQIGTVINSANDDSYQITQPDITTVLLDRTYYALETLPTGGTTNDNYGYDTADTFGGVIVAEGSGTNTLNFNSLAPVTYWHVNGTSDTANLNAATTEIYMPGKEGDYTASYDNSHVLTLTDSVNGTGTTTFNIGLGNGEINFADGNVIGLGDEGDPIEYAGGGANYSFTLDGGDQTIYGNGSNGGAGSFANFTEGDSVPDDAWNITEDSQGRVIFDGTDAGYDGVATLSNIQDVILNGTKYDLVAVAAGGITTGMSSTVSTPTDGTADTVVAETSGVSSTLTFASTGMTYWHANGFNDTANLQAGQTEIYLRDAESDYTISYDGSGSLTLTDTIPDSNGTMTVNLAGGSGDLVFADGETISLDALQAGPSITAETPATVEGGQTTVIGTVTPSIAGDALTLTETAGTGILSLGTVQADGTQQVIYTAPTSIPASTTDAVSYTISENNVSATGAANVSLDAGPTIAAQIPTTVGSGQTTVIGTVTPGITGDALTLTETSGTGILSLGTVQADGTQQVIYIAPASVPTSITDAVSYTISENGMNVTGTASVQVTAAAQPQTITLAAGSSTSLQSGQDTGDSFIFAGTALNNAPDLQFIGPGNNVVATLTVIPNGSGGMSQSSGANVEAIGGIQLNGGTFHDFLVQGAGTLTLDGSSTINNGGSLQLQSFGDVVNLNGTIALGPGGNNNLTIAGLSPSASTTVIGGTIIQDGETDVTSVKFDRGTDFQIDGGMLQLFGGPGSFQGTIGPASSAPGASALGIFGEVDIYYEIGVTGATFDTTTGMLSFLNSAGTVVDNIHFAGDASGLTLTAQPNSSTIAINDRVSSASNLPGNIPLTFHA